MSEKPFLTVEQLRRLTGASPAEIASLTRSGQIKVSGGKVPLVSSIRAVLDLIRATTKDQSLTAAQDAARLARAEATEFALAVQNGELVTEQASENAMLHLCGGLLRRADVMAARVTRDVAQRRLVEAAVREAQHEIARETGSMAQAVKAQAKTPKLQPKAKRKAKNEI